MLEHFGIVAVQQGRECIVEFVDTEEGSLSEPGQQPALDTLNTLFGLWLVFGLFGACGFDGDAVVAGHLGIALVDDDLVSGMLYHRTLEVVGYQDTGHTAKEVESEGVRMDKVLHSL